jgi:hypothetical protein
MSQPTSVTVVSHIDVSTEILSKLKQPTSVEVFYIPCIDAVYYPDCLGMMTYLSNCHGMNRFSWSPLSIPRVISKLRPENYLGKGLRSLRLPRLGLDDTICSIIITSEVELEELDLSWCYVTADGLAEMSKGKIDGLRKLWLRNTQLFYSMTKVCNT